MNEVLHDDLKTFVNVPVHVQYHEFLNRLSMVIRYCPEKYARMLNHASTFLDCPIFFNGLEKDVDLNMKNMGIVTSKLGSEHESRLPLGRGAC